MKKNEVIISTIANNEKWRPYGYHKNEIVDYERRMIILRMLVQIQYLDISKGKKKGEWKILVDTIDSSKALDLILLYPPSSIRITVLDYEPSTAPYLWNEHNTHYNVDISTRRAKW